jgi:cytochrome P450
MNPANATFWFVTHIVSSPTLMAEIRAEIEPAFKSDGTLDTYYLVNHCPILDSVWNEILRYYVCVTTMRYITAPASLNDYSLKEGQNLLYSARQLAHDPAAFGPDFASFNPYRFRDDPSLQHSESFRPFGGGKHICPGRHLAKHVAAAFVALLLRNYDITMPYEQGFPRFFECEPAIGILGKPSRNCSDYYRTDRNLGTEDDLFIELKERT